jgi:Domain of unknown function (DUF382)
VRRCALSRSRCSALRRARLCCSGTAPVCFEHSAQATSQQFAQLKQECPRPEVVEAWDIRARDPKLLVYLKSYRNTVPVPRHWSQKRKYLQSKTHYLHSDAVPTRSYFVIMQNEILYRSFEYHSCVNRAHVQIEQAQAEFGSAREVPARSGARHGAQGYGSQPDCAHGLALRQCQESTGCMWAFASPVNHQGTCACLVRHQRCLGLLSKHQIDPFEISCRRCLADAKHSTFCSNYMLVGTLMHLNWQPHIEFGNVKAPHGRQSSSAALQVASLVQDLVNTLARQFREELLPCCAALIDQLWLRVLQEADVERHQALDFHPADALDLTVPQDLDSADVSHSRSLDVMLHHFLEPAGPEQCSQPGQLQAPLGLLYVRLAAHVSRHVPATFLLAAAACLCGGMCSAATMRDMQRDLDTISDEYHSCYITPAAACAARAVQAHAARGAAAQAYSQQSCPCGRLALAKLARSVPWDLGGLLARPTAYVRRSGLLVLDEFRPVQPGLDVGSLMLWRLRIGGHGVPSQLHPAVATVTKRDDQDGVNVSVRLFATATHLYRGGDAFVGLLADTPSSLYSFMERTRDWTHGDVINAWEDAATYGLHNGDGDRQRDPKRTSWQVDICRERRTPQTARARSSTLTIES